MWGELNNPDMPLVLLHGFLGSAADWQPLVRRLGTGVSTIVPNLPGHGAEPVPGRRFTMEDMVRWLDALLDHHGAGPIALAGYSLGGRVAMYYALSRPDRCARLVVISASPGIQDSTQRSARARRDEAWAHRLESLPMPDFLKLWYEQPVFDSLRSQPALAKRVAVSKLETNRSAAADVLRSLSVGYQRSLWERLAGLTMPVLAIAGELDPRYVSMTQAMASVNPNIKACIIPNAGHIVHAEQEERLAREMAVFLGYLPGHAHSTKTK